MKIWEKNIDRSIESYLNTPFKKCRLYERFKFVKGIIGRKLPNTGDFLDIGCAKGEFIWFLKDFFPRVHFTGVDISKELIRLAKKEPKLKSVEFVKTDARTLDLKRKFDVVLMSGVLSIFDDFRCPLRKMVTHLKPEGWGYIFGSFTEDDIDVLVRYRNNYLGSKYWESSLNMFSMNTIRKALSIFSDRINFYRFDLPIDLAKRKNPIHSYTLNTVEKGRVVLNGANILSQFYLVEFRKNKVSR